MYWPENPFTISVSSGMQFTNPNDGAKITQTPLTLRIRTCPSKLIRAIIGSDHVVN